MRYCCEKGTIGMQVYPFILEKMISHLFYHFWNDLIAHAWIFLSLIWGRISTPSQFDNEQKLPKKVHIIPNFLILHFG